jgi:hypothetical protein
VSNLVVIERQIEKIYDNSILISIMFILNAGATSFNSLREILRLGI